MKKKAFLAILFALFLFKTSFAGESLYCAVPPFLAKAVSPNVLIVQDVSGSMGWSAYNPDDTYSGYCNDDNNGNCPSTYSSSQTYEGYFDPTQVYAYDSSNGFWYQTGSVSTTTHTSCPGSLFTWNQNNNGWWWQGWYSPSLNISYSDSYSGNCLNFLVMSRSDLAKWALTGGEPASCASGNSPTSQCDPARATQTTADGYTGVVLEPSLSNPNEQQIIANNSNFGYTSNLSYNFNVLVPMSRIQSATLPSMEQNPLKPRVGLEMFTTNAYGGKPYILQQKVYIGDYPSSNGGSPASANPNYPYTHVIQYLNYQIPLYGTPTGPAMWDAMAYFSQIQAPFSNGFKTNTGTYEDPLYVCDSNGNNCQAAPCAQNYVILMSDGGWNDPSCYTTDSNSVNNPDPAVPAYEMHIGNASAIGGLSNSLRSDFPNININSIYTIYFGNLGYNGNTENSGSIYGQQALENIAMYGSFNYNPNNQVYPDSLNGYPNNSCYDAVDCGNSQYDNAQGSLCTPLPKCTSDWCDASTGLPNTFFNVNNASQIKNGLLSAFQSIMKRASSATSASPVTQQAQQGSSIIQALFYPSKTFDNGTTTTWLGYLYDWWLYTPIGSQNISILNANTGNYLDPSQDYALNFVFQNNQLQAQESLNGSLINTVPISQLTPVWESGQILWNENPANRTIYTTTGTALIPFTTGNASQFQQYLGTLSGSTYSYLNGPLLNCSTDSTYTNNPADNLIEYIRGCDLQGARNRTVTIGTASDVWKLGDIIYSTPQVWQYNDYADPSQTYSVVYVASNDGMLHAFRLGDIQKTGLTGDQVAKICDSANGCNTDKLGTEMWAFIPQDALPYLRYLADPNYCHIYLNDLTPYIFRANGHVILIGGMRMGGATSTSSTATNSVLVPQSTSPVGLSAYYALDVTNPTQPIFLWEFTNPHLGFSFSGPALININNNYYVMFLSGPTDYQGDSNQDLYAFVLTLNQDFTINSTYVYDFGSSFSNSFGSRLFTQGIIDNNTGNTIAIPFGVSSENGSSTADKWSGSLMLMTTNNSPNPSSWSWNQIMSTSNPVTAKIVHMSCFNDTFLYFGTGKYFTSDDNYNPNTADDLYGIDINNCLNGGHCNVDAGHSNNNTCQELTGSGSSLPSWQIPLDTNDAGYLKERDISDATPTGQNIVFFTTMEPTNNLCEYGGRTRLWGLNCATGSAISDTSCPGYVVSGTANGNVFLQTSTGAVSQVVPANSFQNNQTTQWQQGTPPETSAPFVKPFTSRTGVIIQWLER